MIELDECERDILREWRVGEPVVFELVLIIPGLIG